jgi:hypothetical protein
MLWLKEKRKAAFLIIQRQKLFADYCRDHLVSLADIEAFSARPSLCTQPPWLRFRWTVCGSRTSSCASTMKL